MIADSCGCCLSATDETPVDIENRPGLSVIAYRVGTFSSFRQAMLNAIAETPELAYLKTRLSDDYAITVLELWAIVADVLSFYQERIANEAFLHTATLRDSVLRLSRLLDYQLRPGIAASAYLAFTVEKNKKVQIPVGLRVQSVPGQNEQPQKYETLESIGADARWNCLRVYPEPHLDAPLQEGRTWAFLQAGSPGFEAAARLKPGDELLVFDSEFDRITVKEIKRDQDRLILVWKEPLKRNWSTDAQVLKMKQTFRLFGYNAPQKYMELVDGGSSGGVDFPAKWLYKNLENDDYKLTASKELYLDTSYVGLRGGTKLLIGFPDNGCEPVEVTGVCLSMPSGKLAQAIKHTEAVTKLTLSTSTKDIPDCRIALVYELDGPVIELWPFSYPSMIDMTEFYLPGALIDAETIEIERTLKGNTYSPGFRISLKEIEIGRRVILTDSQQAPVSGVIMGALIYDLADRLESNGRSEIKSGATESDDLLLNGDRMSLITNSISGLNLYRATTAARVGILAASSNLSLEAKECYLRLSLRLDGPINLNTVSAVMLGNIALASHGESIKQESLGDGDASVKFQRFSPKKTPVTFVPSSQPGGATNSLGVLVNGMLWKEVPSLYGVKPTDQVYKTQIADDGTLTLQFGDGKTGARLPSGRGNVVATYRQGSGLAGRVQAQSLTTLLDRPFGLQVVSNPSAADGGADPETLDQSRRNAPKTVKTLGRAVSLRDFEDLAAASGIVAKAAATWVWDGGTRAVHLTVAGQRGGLLSLASLRQLHDSLNAQRDPNRTLLLANYRQVPIVVNVTLKLTDNVVAQDVAGEAREVLLGALSFEALAFGQSIHLSSIFATLQGVAGVVAVDVDLFHFKDRSADQLALRGANQNSVQGHLRIYRAHIKTGTMPLVIPAEQACIEVPSQDVVIMTTGGLSA